MKTYLSNPKFTDNLYYLVDPTTKQIIAKIDKRLWKYYYQPRLSAEDSEGIQPNLYFDEE